MGNGGKKSENAPSDKVVDKAKKPSRRPDDEDYEDGDIATPKRDRYGNDDEPL